MVTTATPPCPKCRTTARSAEACPKCGLRNDRMAAFVPPASPAVTPAALAGWAALEAAWEDPAQHEAVAKLVASTASVGWATRQLADHPDSVRADVTQARLRQLAAIRAMAIAASTATSAPRPARRVNRIAIMLLVLVVLLVAGVLLMRKFDSARRNGDGYRSVGGMPEATPAPGQP